MPLRRKLAAVLLLALLVAPVYAVDAETSEPGWIAAAIEWIEEAVESLVDWPFDGQSIDGDDSDEPEFGPLLPPEG